MCSSSASASASSFFISTDTPSLLRRRDVSIFTSSNSLLFNRRFRNPSLLCLSASLAGRNLELSWFPPDRNAVDNYGGWAIVEAPVQRKKKGWPAFMIGSIGTSVAVLVAAIAYFSLSRRGLKFHFGCPLHALHEMLNLTNSKANQSEITDSGTSIGRSTVSEVSPEGIPDVISETVTSASAEKCERVIVSVAVDSTQQEAVSLLKKLKIIEDDVGADELCTRRVYARWLIRINSLLERNPKLRVVPSISLSGSIVAAYDDVGVDDPDFGCIQALAEAGLIPSKLSGKVPRSNSSNDQGGFYFFPERLISRQDLIDWKTQLEYEFMPRLIEQISRTKVDYMDVKEISSDASPQLFMDMLAGDMSIFRQVFGQSKRFQPNKPSTKAQAAVALTRGRMMEAIYTELMRLEAENSSRQAVMKEIRSELLNRGDIKRFWDEKLNEERARGFEVEKLYLAGINDLEQEKIVQEKRFTEHLKEKTAMDCQRQLLFSLKEEVDEMSERLASERAMYVAEQCNLQDMLDDLEKKQEGMLDAKSILEAEIEALRILRSWIEDDARKSRARAKVLEEVGRRWKWDNHA